MNNSSNCTQPQNVTSSTRGVEFFQFFDKLLIDPVIVIVLFAAILLMLVYCILRMRKNQRQSQVMVIAWSNFSEANTGNSPEIRFSEQVDHLPYNKRFEFPREKIRFGDHLRGGEYGVVWEAYAQGILPNEHESIVVVKKPRQFRTEEHFRCFEFELKVLMHLGQHLNIVSLLGSVTENVPKHEMMAIFEHCPFGDLGGFLLRNRRRFVNQIDRGTDTIDPGILTNPEYIEPDYYTFEDLNELEMSFRTIDLLWWSLQVARGMHYLASCNLVHRELGVRNVLLCDGGNVKICEFSLTRTMHKHEYKEMETVLLPIRWMAIESMTDAIFSTYSDVWSFGVFMWELFSLGEEPYHPEIFHNYADLLSKLNNGYRLPKPTFATGQIFEIMSRCWRTERNERPLFDELERLIGEMIPGYVEVNQVIQRRPSHD